MYVYIAIPTLMHAWYIQHTMYLYTGVCVCCSTGEVSAHKNAINSIATNETCIFTASRWVGVGVAELESDGILHLWRQTSVLPPLTQYLVVETLAHYHQCSYLITKSCLLFFVTRTRGVIWTLATWAASVAQLVEHYMYLEMCEAWVWILRVQLFLKKVVSCLQGSRAA